MAQRREDAKSTGESKSPESKEDSSDDSYSSSEDGDDEPVLKYKRFAKEVVQLTCDASEALRDGSEGTRDVINCITVHPKVLLVHVYSVCACFKTPSLQKQFLNGQWYYSGSGQS